MSAITVTPPFPVFSDIAGAPLQSGFVYVGAAGLNAEANQIPIFWDSELTIPALQPLRTINGYISRNGSPAQVYANAVDYSLLVKSKTNALIWSTLKSSGISSDASGVVYTPAGVGSVATTVQSELRKTVWLDNYDTLAHAIAALPAEGGVVVVPVGRFFAGEWNYNTQYMAKDNVTLRGLKMPTYSANCDRLEGGSIIEGRFCVFANNFHHENIGYDLGKYVCDTRFPGYDTHAANYPLAGGTSTWDAFAFAQPDQVTPLPDRKGYMARNVIGLLRDSYSFGHAILQEGFSGGYVDNVIGMYGFHAHVIKAQNVTGGFIAGYGASADHVIFKSDSYANGGNITINTVETGQKPPNTVPWSTPAKANYGLFLNPATANMSGIKVGKARLKGASELYAANGPSDKILDNVTIQNLEIEGFGLTGTLGIYFHGPQFYRINNGIVTINNVDDAVAYEQPASLGFFADPMSFQSIAFANISLRCLQALGYGNFVIDQLRTTNNINTLYAIADTGRVYVGKESLAGTPTTKFAFNPPTLNAAWQNFPGQGAFRLVLEDYGVKLAGLLKPVGAGSGTLFSLPPYLRPAAIIHTPAVADGSAGQVCRQLEAGPGYANCLMNSGVNSAGAENWLSVDGVSWKLD